MFKVAIIGFGDVAHVHLAAIQHHPLLQLVAICDIDEKVKDKIGDITFFTDYKVMINEVKPDCVHICLPHYLHYEVASECAKLGVHVFCEKPLAISVDEAKEFASLQQQYPNQRFGICLQNRLNNSVVELKKIIESKEFGNVLGVRGYVPWFRPKNYYDEKPWRGLMKYAGGGCMINQSIHTLDLMSYLCGKVMSIKGNCCQLLDYGIEVEDTVNARLMMENGIIGHFGATIANIQNENVQLTVTMEKATYCIGENSLFKVSETGFEKVCEDDKLPGSKFYYGAGHVKIIDQFYTSMKENNENYIHCSEGVNSIVMIDGIVRSSNEKKEITL